VNTLRNRVARITELTGRDVTRLEDRVDLFLALEADGLS
jgi:purine catabolism regulator